MPIPQTMKPLIHITGPTTEVGDLDIEQAIGRIVRLRAFGGSSGAISGTQKGHKIPRVHLRRASRPPEHCAGRAWMTENRLQVTIYHGALAYELLDTLIHEFAHHYCYRALAHPGHGPTFNDVNRRAFAEYVKRYGAPSGRYTDPMHGQAAKRAKHGTTFIVDADNVLSPGLWKLVNKLARSPRQLTIPGTLANEIQCTYVDTFEPDRSCNDERERFCEIWEAGYYRRRGNGWQHVIELERGEALLLHEALDYALDLAPRDVARTAQRQAAQTVGRLLNR